MKTIIITGASGGLGTTVTQHFLSKGYRVAATVFNEDSKKEMPSHPNLEVEAVNLADETEAGAFVQRMIDRHKQIDGALLLVGGFAVGNIAATGTSDIKKQISLNFDTAYHVARPLFDHMLHKNNGRIVLVGSRPALQAKDGKNLVAYALSKSLLFKLAEFMNEEAKGKNVTATVVAPSTIDTPANRKSMPSADPETWVKPEALAEVLEFIVSEKSAVLRETVLKVYNNA